MSEIAANLQAIRRRISAALQGRDRAVRVVAVSKQRPAEAIAVITLSSIAANCSAILGGVLVCGDPLGNGTFEIMARSLAFVAVIGAAALMPAPRHAANTA